MKSLNYFKGTLFVKRKAESNFPMYRDNIFEKIGIVSITDYIIRAEYF